jgi:peptidoglycan/xylan/chitin deacetylase (PgdA/CDA1 family)
VQRARRRRRRLASLAVCVAILAAAGAVVLATRGGGQSAAGRSAAGSGHATLVAGASHPRAPSSPPQGRAGLPAVIAAGNAEIRRLAALGLPIYCGGPRGNEVAFTFDDGPGVYTYLALKKLRQAQERATFFLVGRSINNFPGYLPRELQVGTLGDHTYTHPDLVTLSPGEVNLELTRAAQLITAQSGQPIDLWRPPYEADNASVRQVANRLGLLEILWSIDSRDSLGADWAQIIQIVESGLRPGSIVLFHENHGQTIRALTTLLPYLHEHHLRAVSVPELLATDPPSAAQLRLGGHGCGGPAQPGSPNGVAGG